MKYLSVYIDACYFPKVKHARYVYSRTKLPRSVAIISSEVLTTFFLIVPLSLVDISSNRLLIQSQQTNAVNKVMGSEYLVGTIRC